jgi:hypothetical protein
MAFFLSRFLADGCCPDRETWRALEAAGFAPLSLEHFRVQVPIVSPHIAGVATKPPAIAPVALSIPRKLTSPS